MPAASGALTAAAAPRSPVLGEDNGALPSGADLAAAFANSAAAQDMGAAVSIDLETAPSAEPVTVTAARTTTGRGGGGARGRGVAQHKPPEIETVLAELHSQVWCACASVVCSPGLTFETCWQAAAWLLGQCAGVLSACVCSAAPSCIHMSQLCFDALASACTTAPADVLVIMVKQLEVCCDVRWSMWRRHTHRPVRTCSSCWLLLTSATSTGSLASL